MTRDGQRFFLAYWVPVLAVVVAIFAVSSLPGRQLTMPTFRHMDKIYHFSVFGLLGLMLFRALAVQARWPVALLLMVTFAAAAVVGALDESYQLLIPGRSSDFHDLVADTLGGSAGAVGWLFVRRRFRGLES